MAATYNGTTGTADEGYSTKVQDLNIFYDVSLLKIHPISIYKMGGIKGV